MPWQKNGTPNTLNLAGDTISVTDLTNATFNQFLAHTFPSTSAAQDWTFNGSTGSLYAFRRSNNGGSDVTSVSQTSVDLRFNSNENYLHVIDTVWQSGNEKLSIVNNIGNNVAGATNAPSRKDVVFKYVPSPDEELSQAKLDKGAFTNFATDSNLSALSDIVPIPETIGGWVELGRTTLGSAGDTMEVSGLANKRYYQILWNGITSGNLDDPNLKLGNGTIDTGSNFVSRGDWNGSEETNINQTSILLGKNNGASDRFGLEYIANLSGNEKLVQNWSMQVNTTASSAAPLYAESVGKWANTANPLDVLRITNVGSGSFDTGSEVVVLGWDPSDIHTTNFWEELASVDLSGGSANLIDSGTFTAKKYLWIQLYVSTTGGACSQRLTFNSDTGTNYSQRVESDGGSFVAGTSKASIDGFNDDMLTNSAGFTNLIMINNSAQVKTGFIDSIDARAAGSGNAPGRDTGGFKWSNTLAQVTKVTFTNNKAGSMDTTTTLKIWGSN